MLLELILWQSSNFSYSSSYPNNLNHSSRFLLSKSKARCLSGMISSALSGSITGINHSHNGAYVVGGGLSSMWNSVSFSMSILHPKALLQHSFLSVSSHMTWSRPDSKSFSWGLGFSDGVINFVACLSLSSHSFCSLSILGKYPDNLCSSSWAYSKVLGKSVMIYPLDVYLLSSSISQFSEFSSIGFVFQKDFPLIWSAFNNSCLISSSLSIFFQVSSTYYSFEITNSNWSLIFETSKSITRFIFSSVPSIKDSLNYHPTCLKRFQLSISMFSLAINFASSPTPSCLSNSSPSGLSKNSFKVSNSSSDLSIASLISSSGL